MTDTTATLEPAGGRAKTMAKTAALHMLDVWSHSPAGVARGISDLWGWASFRKAYAAEMEGLTKPSDRIKAHTRLTERLGSAPFWRKAAVVLAALAVLALALNLLTSAGPAWWPLLLAMTYGAGRYALRPTKAAHDGTEDADDPSGAKLRKALVQSVPAIRERLKEHPDSLKIGKEHEDGNGYTRKITLPIGVSVTKVAGYVEDIAGGLDVAENRVIIESKRDGSPREAMFWVAADVLDKLPKPQWALRHATKFDLRQPIPLGETLKGEPVSITLACPGGSILVAGKSGSGKTTTMRAIIAAAILDPRATIAALDLKDAGDYDTLEPALDWYRYRVTDDTLDAAEVMLRQAVAILDDGKTMRMANPPLTVIAIDEAHNLFNEKDRSKRFTPLIKRLVAEGRAAGIVLIMATQNPTSESLPTSIGVLLGARICQRVDEFSMAQAALGTAANKPGRKFDELANGQVYISDEKLPYNGMVRVSYVSEEMAGEVARRHRRETGRRFPTEAEFPTYPTPADGPRLHAVTDPEPEPYAPTVVDLTVAAMRAAGRDRAATTEILGWLLAASDDYAGWAAADVTKALKSDGWTPRGDGTVWLNGKSQRGALLADLEAAQGAAGGAVV